VNFPPGIRYNAEQRLVMAQEIRQSRAEKRKLRHDQKGKPVTYEVGDLDLERTHHLSSSFEKCIHKFFMLYEGPFVVKEIINQNAYVVYDPNTNQVRGCYNVITCGFPCVAVAVRNCGQRTSVQIDTISRIITSK